MLTKLRVRTAAVAVVTLVWASSPVCGIELITNGGFETGDFTGWAVVNLAGGFGSFSIDDTDGTTPISGLPTVGPSDGAFYAVADQGGPGTHVLSQSFTVPVTAGSVTLSFNMFVNDWSEAGPVDQGLDHTLVPNQHGRVDIMNAAAGAFDTGPGVLANLFLGVDPGSDPHGYTPYVFDITPVVTGGGTFVLRFAGCENVFHQHLGVDNVSITVCTADGIIDEGEECDDGNVLNGDGCDQRCRIEPCHTCAGAPSACSPVPDGTGCDDQAFCNGTDTCAAGACSAHAGDPCAGGMECNDTCDEANDTCFVPNGTVCTDEGNVCTDDVCDGLGTCVHPGNFFVPCDDGLFCNGTDSCFNGNCTLHDGDPCLFTECTIGCDEINTVCIAATSGTPCFEDGSVCTTDQCDSMGNCTHPPLAGGTPCTNDANACTTDQCNGFGACVHPTAPDGTVCNDADACTQADQCQSGQCVGANPVLCLAPACHRPGTCDPSSGTCTNCPAVYSQGNAGCQKVYAIDVTLLDNQDSFCDGSGANRYNGCGATPFGFHWTDTGDASVGAVTRVDVQIEAGLDCDFVDHIVSLNASSIGEYASEDSCSCVPTHSPRLLENVNASAYVKGGANSVSITGNSCDGLSQDANGHYAMITVTYQDLGPPVDRRDGCRQADKSKLKYRNDASDDRDSLKWKWSKGLATTQEELADPTDAAHYQLCVFEEAGEEAHLLIGADVPPSTSMWRATGSTGYKYKDPTAGQGGMSKIVAKGGADGKAKIVLAGKGAALSDPTLPPNPDTTGIRVQLTNSSSGVCWESEFPFGTALVDEAGIKASVP